MANITNQVQRESAARPVSGKSTKGSGSMYKESEKQNQESQKRTKGEFTLALERIEQQAKKNLFSLENNLISDEIREKITEAYIEAVKCEMKRTVKEYAAEYRARMEYNAMRGIDQNIKRSSISSSKIYYQLKKRLEKMENRDWNYYFSSTDDGIREVSYSIATASIDYKCLTRVFSSCLMREAEEKREARLLELRATCQKWLEAGISRGQAELLSATIQDPTLRAYIEFLDLSKKTLGSEE